MFEQSLLNSKGRKPWAIALSSAFQCVLIGILTLIPLAHTQVLPRLAGKVLLPALPPPPKGPVKFTKPVRREWNEDRLVAPNKIPETIAPIEDELPPPSPAGPGEIWGAILRSPTPVISPVARTETPQRVRVGGQMQQARLVSQPKPVYPPLARVARIQGTVRLEAIISKDGTIESLKVTSGHPWLTQAALEAVRQWRYQPTILNGEPVEVSTTIEVNFTLSP